MTQNEFTTELNKLLEQDSSLELLDQIEELCKNAEQFLGEQLPYQILHEELLKEAA